MKNKIKKLLTTKRGKALAVTLVLALIVCAVATTAAATGLFTNNIGEARAKKLALEHAGATAEQVSFMRAWLDVDDGVKVYEVEFYWQGNEYDYAIDSKTGTVLDYDIDAQNELFFGSNNGQQGNTENADYIGNDAALAAALSHAGLNAENVTVTKNQLEPDDGIYEYDIRFFASDKEYEYEINAVTGAVNSADVDRFTGALPVVTTSAAAPIVTTAAPVIPGATSEATEAPSVKVSTPVAPVITIAPQSGRHIGTAAALNIALNHAGLSENGVTVIKNRLDLDDGVFEYDIEFITDSKKYEYEINASTGAITGIDSEYIGAPVQTTKPAPQTTAAPTAPAPQTTQPASQNTVPASVYADYIGYDAALSIALNHARLTADEVKLVENHLENDDGIYEYNIEFIKGTIKYEYEINAASGAITDYDRESTLFD